MELEELKTKLNIDLSRQLVTPSILLDNLRLINEDSRRSSAYVDPLYIPFYYYLGKYLSPKNVFESGTGLGLFITAFLKSCKSVENLFLFQGKEKDFFSFRFAIKNIKSCYRKNTEMYYGDVMDKSFNEKINEKKWDLALFNDERNYDESMYLFDFIWESLEFDGFMIIDHIESNQSINKAFFNFCKIKNKDPILFKTRYGVGILKKV